MQQAVTKGNSVFTQLGLSIGQLQAMTPDQQFEAIADAISHVPDPTQRAADAMAVFGRAGEDMLPLINQGAAGIDQLRARAEELGVAMNDKTVTALHDAKVSVEEMTGAFSGLWTMLVSKVAPALGGIAEQITVDLGGGSQLQNLRSELEDLQRLQGMNWYGAATGQGQGGLQARIDQLKQQISDMQITAAGLTEVHPVIRSAYSDDQWSLMFAKERSDQLDAQSAMVMQQVEFNGKWLEEQKQAVDQSNGLWDQDTSEYLNNLDLADEATKTSLEKQLEAQQKFHEQLDALVAAGKITQGEANARQGAYDQSAGLSADALQPINITAKKMLTDTQKSYAAMRQLSDDATKSMASGFEQFFADPVTVGIKGLAKDFLSAVEQMIAKWEVLQLFGEDNTSGVLGKAFSSIFGGIGNVLSGQRAGGGYVSAGDSYLVGENGPELFRSSSAGNITPNGALGGAGGGFTINASVDARGSTPDAIKLIPFAMQKAIQQAKREVLDMKRRGLLAAGVNG
jgi:hypothetical protein